MSAAEHRDAGDDFPPDVPEIDRRIRLGARQIAGLLALTLIPALALAGLLEYHERQQALAGAAIDLDVTVPTRVRLSGEATLRVIATNRAEAPVRLTIRLPERYLAGFITAQGVREPVTTHAELGPIEPGGRRMLELPLVAHRPGIHKGTLLVLAPSGDTLVVPLRTFILP